VLALLQHAATHYYIPCTATHLALQHNAINCHTVQYTAPHRALKYSATQCNTFCTATHWNKVQHTWSSTTSSAPHYISLHHTAPYCATPHHKAPHYVSLHHTTPHYTTLHHTTPHYTTLHHTAPHVPHYTTQHHTTTHLAIRRKGSTLSVRLLAKLDGVRVGARILVVLVRLCRRRASEDIELRARRQHALVLCVCV